jgi:uncharacterized membrane protein (UPF0127 family)
MVKQTLLPLAAVAIFIITVGLLVQNSSKINIPGINNFFTLSTTSKKTIKIGETSLQVENADTSDKRIKGLSDRKDLDKDSGMLFIFGTAGDESPQNVTPAFWMKGMLFPLDIIWINDGKVVRIDKNIPAPSPNTPDSKLKTYTAGQPIDYVLEVNAGFTDQNNLKIGDGVDILK